MLSDKDNHKLEQGASAIGEILPKVARNLYLGFIREGFSESDAVRLVQSYIEGVAKRE